ncbi:MAG: MarR family transcriptional regulator [Verrucomicrobiota bacterium]
MSLSRTLTHVQGEESQSLPHLLADLASIPNGISLTAIKALYYIRERTPNQGQLASILGVSRADVTGITDRLESRGLAVRVRNERDRRSTFVSATDEGLALAKSVFGTSARALRTPRLASAA